MSPVAVLVHGAGSCPETARLMLGPAVPPGVETLAVEARGGILDVVGRIAEAAQGHDVVLVAGISLGAHAAVRWAATGGRPGALLLAMPAWTGEPGPVAGLTASSADEIEQRGRDAVLADISAAAPDDWVGEELRRGWSTFADDELVAALRSAASSPGPTLVELASVGAPSVVVALRDDPLHPERVARQWAGVIPGAHYVTVGRREPLADRGALGRAGGLALSRT